MKITLKHWWTEYRAQFKGLFPKFWILCSIRYKIIEDEDHREKEEEDRNLNYELIGPIVTVFNEIEDL